MSTSTYQDTVKAFYMCGLEEAAAEEAARAVAPMQSKMRTTDDSDSCFDHPSWALYRFWLSQSPSFRVAQTIADLHQVLTEFRFRPEVIPLATFEETYIPHLDARNWARQLALGVHKQTSSFPPMPQARL